MLLEASYRDLALTKQLAGDSKTSQLLQQKAQGVKEAIAVIERMIGER